MEVHKFINKYDEDDVNRILEEGESDWKEINPVMDEMARKLYIALMSANSSEVLSWMVTMLEIVRTTYYLGWTQGDTRRLRPRQEETP